MVAFIGYFGKGKTIEDSLGLTMKEHNEIFEVMKLFDISCGGSYTMYMCFKTQNYIKKTNLILYISGQRT